MIVAVAWRFRLPCGGNGKVAFDGRAGGWRQYPAPIFCERGLDPDDVEVMALNHDADLALLLVAVVKAVATALGCGIAHTDVRPEAKCGCAVAPLRVSWYVFSELAVSIFRVGRDSSIRGVH